MPLRIGTGGNSINAGIIKVSFFGQSGQRSKKTVAVTVVVVEYVVDEMVVTEIKTVRAYLR